MAKIKVIENGVTITMLHTLAFKECKKLAPIPFDEFFTPEIKGFIISRLKQRIEACDRNVDLTNPLAVNEQEIVYQPFNRIVQHYSFRAMDAMITSIDALEGKCPIELIDWRQVAKALYYHPGEVMENKRYYLPNGLYVRFSDIVNYVNEMRDVQLVREHTAE